MITYEQILNVIKTMEDERNHQAVELVRAGVDKVNAQRIIKLYEIRRALSSSLTQASDGSAFFYLSDLVGKASYQLTSKRYEKYRLSKLTKGYVKRQLPAIIC